jgi:hypothetical protein
VDASGLEFIFVIQSAISKISTEIMNELSSWDITKEFTGLSLATREVIQNKLQQLCQGKQEWINFGDKPTIIEPSLAEQAILFPQIGFECEAAIPALFKLKQHIMQHWQKSPVEMLIAYRAIHFTNEFKSCVECTEMNWTGRIWILDFDDDTKSVMLNWLKGNKRQHLMIHDKRGQANAMGRSFKGIVEYIYGYMFLGIPMGFLREMNVRARYDLK